MPVSAGDAAKAIAAAAALELAAPAIDVVCLVVAEAIELEMQALALERQAIVLATQVKQTAQVVISGISNPSALVAYATSVAKAEAQALLDETYNEAMLRISKLCPANSAP